MIASKLIKPLGLIVSVFYFSQFCWAQDRVPRFEDYPVKEVWNGPAASLKLDHRSRWFKTRLHEVAKQPPNFAGHYSFAGWGCGSACAAGAIIDLETGIVYPPPLGGRPTDPKINIYQFWIFSGGPIEGRFIEYRRDSGMIIVRKGFVHANDPTLADWHYLVWEGNSFRQLLVIHEKHDGNVK